MTVQQIQKEIQDIKSEYDDGLIDFEEMSYQIHTIQENCKHTNTTISKNSGEWEWFCDACGKQIEDEE